MLYAEITEYSLGLIMQLFALVMGSFLTVYKIQKGILAGYSYGVFWSHDHTLFPFKLSQFFQFLYFTFSKQEQDEISPR